MYNRLKALYRSGKISEQQLSIAVTKGWITEAQKREIISEVN